MIRRKIGREALLLAAKQGPIDEIQKAQEAL
jgi:hypothetical protein